MKASELITELSKVITEFGDLDVLTLDEAWIITVDEVDVLTNQVVEPYGPNTSESEKYTLEKSIILESVSGGSHG